jgi:hypothetical protein
LRDARCFGEKQKVIFKIGQPFFYIYKFQTRLAQKRKDKLMGRRKSKKGGGINETPLLTGVSDDEDLLEAGGGPLLGPGGAGGGAVVAGGGGREAAAGESPTVLLGVAGGARRYEPLDLAPDSDSDAEFAMDGHVAVPDLLEVKGSVSGATFNLSNTMLGAGLLVYPQAFSAASLFPALMVLLFCAGLSYEGGCLHTYYGELG